MHGGGSAGRIVRFLNRLMQQHGIRLPRVAKKMTGGVDDCGDEGARAEEVTG